MHINDQTPCEESECRVLSILKHYILKGTIQQVLLVTLARYLSVLELLINTSWPIRRAQLWDPKPVSEHPGGEDTR